MRLGSFFAFATLLVPGALLPRPATAQVVGPSDDWQQGVEYRIEARLDEEDEVLRGRARVRYRNNAPHALEEFFFHLYLNAFRPASAWARADLEHGITTFQELGPEEHGFERILEMSADGAAVELRYPFAPDSTIVGFDLPEPLEPGETLVLDYRWDARPSSVPRRQGRRGRQYDFAQWYPRVVVHDDEGWRAHPLYRQGEFYGEFATYDVTLDLEQDQVTGATGVPVEGDPGWRRAAAPGTDEVDHQREWYGSMEGPPCIQRGDERICDEYPAKRLPPAEALGLLGDVADPGRKRVRWHAENVHHFAWSTSPDYIYEEGRWEDVTIRVLYRPGDEESWGGGVAVERTARALEWLDDVFGDYGYPQVTNLHRIEGGGTEFPMVVMDGSASQGLILHEVGHIYVHGMLANNEWYEGWLDEGLSSFQTSWFYEESGAGSSVWRGSGLSILRLELLGLTEPVVLPAEEYSEYGIYGAMIYTKGSLIFWMLREMAGEERFRKILRTYYERYRFHHVDSEAFEEVAEEVMRTDLDGFFRQWLHTTGVVDYALDDVDVTHDEIGWTSTLALERRGDLRMPIPVRIHGGEGTRDVVVDDASPRPRGSFRTDFRPTRVELDPDGTILDWNVANDVWEAGAIVPPALEVSLDNPLDAVPVRWKSVPVELFPLGWYNLTAGWVAGLQIRSSRLGVADRTLVRIGLPAASIGGKGGLVSKDYGSLYWRLEDPIRDGRVRRGNVLEGFAGEGRAYARARLTRTRRDPPLSGRPSSVRAFGSLAWVWDDAYLVPGRWTPGTKLTAELGVGVSGVAGGDGLPLALDLFAAAGFDTRNHRYLRAGLTAEVEDGSREEWAVRGRLFAGASYGRNPDEGGDDAWGSDFVPRERMFFLAGGDPYQALSNPWVRSREAPLEVEGFVPGGGQIRGLHPGLPLPQMVALNLEVATPEAILEVGPGVAGRLLAFGGVATGGWVPPTGNPVFGDPDAVVDVRESAHVFWSAGPALEVGLEDAPARLRLDLPVVVSDPELAGTGQGAERAAFRWTISLRGSLP